MAEPQGHSLMARRRRSSIRRSSLSSTQSGQHRPSSLETAMPETLSNERSSGSRSDGSARRNSYGVVNDTEDVEDPKLEEPKASRLSRVSRIYHVDESIFSDEANDRFSDTADFEEMMAKRNHKRKSQVGGDDSDESLWTTSSCWKRATASIIGINTFLIAMEALYIQYELSVFDYVELAFTGFYVMELLACIIEQGPTRFLCNDDWWNVFDLCVTVLCVVDLAVVSESNSGAGTTRLFRLFRILRVCRALRFMNELDYVLVQITRSTLKLAIVASVALIVSSIIATHMLWDCPEEEVSKMFSNLGQSLWTMFKIMTLDNWSQMVELVIKERPEMTMFFVVFIFTTAISLISLAPAMFIDISLRKMEHEDFMEQERSHYNLRRDKRNLLRTLFKLTDVDENGTISVSELRSVLTNETTLNELEEAGITSASDLRDVRLGLFDLWEEHTYQKNVDETEITMEEFTDGLMRMHEDISQAVLWRSTTSTRLMLRDFAAVVMEELQSLREALDDKQFDKRLSTGSFADFQDGELSMTSHTGLMGGPHSSCGLADWRKRSITSSVSRATDIQETLSRGRHKSAGADSMSLRAQASMAYKLNQEDSDLSMSKEGTDSKTTPHFDAFSTGSMNSKAWETLGSFGRESSANRRSKAVEFRKTISHLSMPETPEVEESSEVNREHADKHEASSSLSSRQLEVTRHHSERSSFSFAKSATAAASSELTAAAPKLRPPPPAANQSSELAGAAERVPNPLSRDEANARQSLLLNSGGGARNLKLLGSSTQLKV